LRLTSSFVQLSIATPCHSNSGILSCETQDFASLLADAIGMMGGGNMKNAASRWLRLAALHF